MDSFRKDKEALSNENSEIYPGKENPLITISYLMDHVVSLLSQVVNTYAYIRRLNILMSFMSDKKKVEMMLKETAEAFRDNEKMLFGEVVAKSLTSKNKWRKLFVIQKSKEYYQGTRIPESNNPFRRLLYFVPQEIEGQEYSHKLVNQFQMLGHRKEVKILSFTPIPSILELLYPVLLNSRAPLFAQNIPILPKTERKIFSQRLNKTNKQSHNLRGSARLQYPPYCAAKTGKHQEWQSCHKREQI